eukprot:tig00021723_g23231.t1
MGASYTITCSGANLTAYAGTVTGAAPDFTPGAASSTMSTNSSTAASLFGARGRARGGAAGGRVALGPDACSQPSRWAAVGDVSSSGRDAVLAAVSWNNEGGAVARDELRGDGYYSYLGVASSATAYSTDGGERDGGTPIPQSTTSVTVPVSWALSRWVQRDNVAPTYGPLEVSCSGAGVTRTGSLASGTITAGRRAPT